MFRRQLEQTDHRARTSTGGGKWQITIARQLRDGMSFVHTTTAFDGDTQRADDIDIEGTPGKFKKIQTICNFEAVGRKGKR